MSKSIGDKCTICVNSIREDDNVNTKCGHKFHFSCMCKNIKKNSDTGDKCPLYIKELIEASRSKVVPIYNRLSSRRVFYRNVLRNNMHSIVSNRELYNNINSYISKLSFGQLKEKLKNRNLSTRGYIRSTLENRLKRELIISNS